MDDILRDLPSAAFTDGRWWAMPVGGDGMSPTLDREDIALVVPCHHYEGAAIYVLHDPRSGAEYIRRIELPYEYMDNVLYSEDKKTRHRVSIDRAYFDVHVIGKVVAVCKPFR